MLLLNGHLVDADARGGFLTYRVPFTDWARFVRQGFETAEVGLADGRTISPDQRRKAYALMGEISAWSGFSPDEIKLTMKQQYIDQHMTALQKQLFSLSNCDMTTAREFISYLIAFILEFDIPTSVPLQELCEDVRQYVHACLMHKKCAVCGKKAELHHVDRVGMGRDRRDICHIGMQALPLCREHHMQAHQHGDESLMHMYHLETVEIDEAIAKIYRLNTKEGKK